MKVFKIIAWIAGGIVIIFVGIIAYVKFFLPNIPVKELSVEVTPERVERGAYLANHVMVCMDCHSTRDWSKYSGPLQPGTLGKGGETFDQKMGLPGKFISPNITPYKLKNWTDGEIYRAITSGVNKAGDPLFPLMPYHAYGKADNEDIYSVIAYLRQLEPVVNDVPRSQPDFPMGIIMNLMPAENSPSPIPSKDDRLAYGKYLTTVAACADCHTPLEKGKPVEALTLAGGREFEMPFGTLRAPNITSDQATGIGSWTQEVFVNRFKSYDSIEKLDSISGPDQFNTIMPWNMYAGMSNEDLQAIYAYLKSLQPISHEVEKVSYKK